MEKNKIGKFIATKRKEKGLTQAELGKILSVTDKAVSKWERGLGLPDIMIVKSLAKTLDVSVSDILSGEKNENENVDVEAELTKIKERINHQHKKKIMIIIILFSLIIITIILKNISFGYTIKKVYYNHANKNSYINVGVPKTSFLMKYRDKSYSFKNFRNASILENEIKQFLKSLDYLTCNDTIYYYNSKGKYSITAYAVEKHILYNNITYTIADGDFCYMDKLSEYTEKLGGLKKIHSMNNTYSLEDNWENLLVVKFMDGISDDKQTLYEFKANLKIEYVSKVNENKTTTIVLEDSTGNFEIKDDKLYYYRTSVTNKTKDINIPEVSTFKIDNSQLVLLDDYLNKYYDKQIILK